MAQMFEFKKVTVGPRALTARVELAPNAPLMTSEDPDAVARILELLPGLADHVCLGDVAPTFGEVISDTELAHLLEHVSVELLAQSNIAGDVSRGQTQEVAERIYEITLGCPDDVLVAGALSSAAWILQWAFSGGGDPEPNIEATVGGLVSLVEDLCASEAETETEAEEPLAETQPEPEPQAFDEPAEPERAPEPESAPEPLEAELAPAPLEAPAADAPEPADSPSGERAPAEKPEVTPAPQTDGWDMDNIPRPHLVR